MSVGTNIYGDYCEKMAQMDQEDGFMSWGRRGSLDGPNSLFGIVYHVIYHKAKRAYLKASSLVPGLSITTQKVVEISTTGSLVKLVNPNIIMASAHLPSDKAKEINSQDLTWLFPYCLMDGSTPLICKAETLQLLSTKAITVICLQCNDSTDNPQSHMSGHILQSICRVEEVIVSPIDHLFPCGFCGHSQLQHPDCVIKVQIKFAYVEKGSKRHPCHNVPVTNWQDGVWRYNMEHHLNFYHSEYTHPDKVSGLPLPCKFATATLLDPHEEEKFSVPQHPTSTNIIKKDMEGMSACEMCRSANANAFAASATRASMVVVAIQSVILLPMPPKSNSEPKVVAWWMPVEEEKLVEFLYSHCAEAMDGMGNFKPQMYNHLPAAIAAYQMPGTPVKTQLQCKNKWRVCLIFS
ncbi:hypothetical protein F5J12DRAFT_783100 [Pisolithus orientalis]|uniref:uncharacterized protein n=1 Tax=Pisolithus orientalis TaxID=936130 RepID=UPI002224F481|nr:uncharacterized protein F5J12DRAFT_783100 [Pisolithus orientalis]KAI6006348.1 hypothetical protein F5J12DRAFT_783100 [Pisolithus orientalis]